MVVQELRNHSDYYLCVFNARTISFGVLHKNLSVYEISFDVHACFVRHIIQSTLQQCFVCSRLLHQINEQSEAGDKTNYEILTLPSRITSRYTLTTIFFLLANIKLQFSCGPISISFRIWLESLCCCWLSYVMVVMVAKREACKCSINFKPISRYRFKVFVAGAMTGHQQNIAAYAIHFICIVSIVAQ